MSSAPSSPRESASLAIWLTPSAVVLLAVLWMVPAAALLLASVHPSLDMRGWWPAIASAPSLDAYREVIGGGPTMPTSLLPFLLNSTQVAIPAVLVTLTLGFLAGYALAWLPVPGAKAVLLGLVAAHLLPVPMALLPLARMLDAGWSVGSVQVIGGIGLGASPMPLWLAHVVFALPLTTLLAYAAMTRVPREVIEAARLDGAGHLYLFGRVLLPMLLPALAALALLLFIRVWNDLLIGLVFAGGITEVSPVTAYLSGLQAGGSPTALLSAGAVVSVLVPVVLYAAWSGWFHRGVRAGAALSRW